MFRRRLTAGVLSRIPLTSGAPVAVSASFFLTLFLLVHHCDACGLRRTRNLCCRLSEPGFETGLAESCVIARNQRSLAEFRPRVKRIWISDDFAGIFEAGQVPPDQFIHPKLFRASNFDDAYGRAPAILPTAVATSSAAIG